MYLGWQSLYSLYIIRDEILSYMYFTFLLKIHVCQIFTLREPCPLPTSPTNNLSWQYLDVWFMSYLIPMMTALYCMHSRPSQPTKSPNVSRQISPTIPYTTSKHQSFCWWRCVHYNKHNKSTLARCRSYPST